MQLEADKKLTVSKAPRLLCELFETLRVMAGKMRKETAPFYDSESCSRPGTLNLHLDVLMDEGFSNLFNVKAFKTIPGVTKNCGKRDKAKANILQKYFIKQLPVEISDHIDKCLGGIWSPVENLAPD